MSALLVLLRRYQIHLWATGSCAALALVIVFSLDSAFKARKKELIIQAKQALFDSDPLLINATRISRQIAQVGRYTDTARRELYLAFSQLVEADNIIYRASFTIADETPWIEVVNQAKYRRLNTLANSLFSRDFSYYIYQPHRRHGEIIANTRFYYTSAPVDDIPGLGLELIRYRTLLALSLVALVYAYTLLLRKVLQPITRVTTALERSIQGPVMLIEDAVEPLERGYNQLARNTKIVELTRALSDLSSAPMLDEAHGDDPAFVFLPEALACVRRIIGYDRLDALRATAEPNRLRLALSVPDWQPGDESCQEREVLVPAGWQESREPYLIYPEENHPLRRSLQESGDPLAVAVLAAGEEIVGLLVFRGIAGRPLRPTDLEEVARVRDALANAVLRVINRQLLLDRERSAVTGTLVTNLGHDLTNIIATSRWDLQTLQRALESGALQVSPQRSASVTGALQGLLNNMTLLQEVLNIYRAYGFARRPVYETVSLNDVVNSMHQLFLRSSSQEMVVVADYAPDLPPCDAEPRLLKVAIFNLLTNAARATAQTPQGPAATICLRTRRLEDGRVEVSVTDQGTGFRDRDGRLLEDREIQKALRFGFTTKPDGTGGQGLSWVRTIIEEFHQGEVTASNRPQGGAQVCLRFPPTHPNRKRTAGGSPGPQNGT